MASDGDDRGDSDGRWSPLSLQSGEDGAGAEESGSLGKQAKEADAEVRDGAAAGDSESSTDGGGIGGGEGKNSYGVRSLFSLLKRNGRYRLLFVASCISWAGDWFSEVAAISVLNQLVGTSSSAVGWLYVARLIPPTIFAPIVGSVADKFSRPMIMVVSDLTRAMCVLGFIFVKDTTMLWLMYLLKFGLSALGAFFEPARSALIPQVVTSEDDLAAANTLDGVVWSLMSFVGSALGAVVVAAFGTDANFLIDCCSYVGSAGVVGIVWYKLESPEYRQLDGKGASGFSSESALEVVGSDGVPPAATIELAVGGAGPPADTELAGDSAAAGEVDSTNTESDTGTSDQAHTHLEGQRERNGRDSDPDPAVAHSLQVQDAARSDVRDKEGLCAFMAGGAVHMWQRRELLWLTGFKALGNIPMGITDLARISLFEVVFSNVPIATGLAGITTSEAIGNLVAPAIVLPLVGTSLYRMRLALAAAFGIVSLTCLATALAPSPMFVYAASTASGFGYSIQYIYTMSMLQRGIQDSHRGRVFALSLALRTFISALAVVAGGVLMDSLHVPARHAMLMMVFVSASFFLLWCCWYLPKYGRASTVGALSA